MLSKGFPQLGKNFGQFRFVGSGCSGAEFPDALGVGWSPHNDDSSLFDKAMTIQQLM
jgi:hypothetical protein